MESPILTLPSNRTVKILDKNSPAQASESSCNVTLQVRSETGKVLFWLSRIGEATLGHLCSLTPVTKQYGDLMGHFSRGSLVFTQMGSQEEVCTLVGKDKEAFVFFLGEHLGYTRAALEARFWGPS